MKNRVKNKVGITIWKTWPIEARIIINELEDEINNLKYNMQSYNCIVCKFLRFLEKIKNFLYLIKKLCMYNEK